MNTDLLSLARLHGDFWAIKPEYGTGVSAYLRDADYDAHLAAYQARVSVPTARQGDVRDEDRPYAITRGVALISIEGVMTRRPTSYGGCSTLLTQHAVRLAGRDQDVQSILIVFDSPGGSVNGLQELTDEIAAVAAVKPVRGYVPAGSFSASYYVSTACTSLMAERTAQVGSLGTMTVLRDSSGQAKADGVVVEVISTNDEIKGQGTPGTPISDAYRTEQRNHVLAYGQLFKDAIAAGRKLSEAQIKAVFTGACFMAPDALKLGLVDRLGTLDDAMAELVETTSTEDDDPDEDLVAKNVAALIGAKVLGEPVPASQASALPLFTAVEPPAPAPTISAPGGRPGTAGNPQAPSAGAENQTGKKPMRQELINAFAGENMGTFVAALQGVTSDNPELLARVIAGSARDQIAAAVSEHPVIALARANSITDAASLNDTLVRAKNGDTYLDTVRKEAKAEAVRAFGAQGGLVGAAVDHQPLANVIISRDAWRASADSLYGIGNDGSAPTRKTAATGTVAIDAQETTNRAFDRLDPEAKAKVLTQAPTDEKRQDELASAYLKGMGVEA